MLNDFWSRSRHLRLVFLGIMVLLTSTFGGVTWWLLKQDQQLSAQRVVERQAAAADLVVATLEKRISSVDHELDRILSKDDAKLAPLAGGAMFVRFAPGSVTSWPEQGLVYSLVSSDAPDAIDMLFRAADKLEFQDRNYSAALDALLEWKASNDTRVQAAALARIARNYRKSGRVQESLQASRRLGTLGAVSVAGMPAALAGPLSALYTLDQQKESSRIPETARALNEALNSGRWSISAATYASLSHELKRWLPSEEKQVQRPAVLMQGVEWLWEQWNRDHADATGRHILATSSGPLLLQWKTAGKTAVAFVADADHLRFEWLPEVRPRLDNLHMDLSLTDAEGHLVLGKAPAAGGRPAIRLSPDTSLPWTLQVFSTTPDEGIGARRNLLLLSMGSMLVLILTGTWLISHAVTRELAVARLKADFVSTVSHEFRTPLTTLCQLSELLKRDRVATFEDRQQYYELLYTESNRLRRLVEGLLTFGRLESGKFQFHFEPLDVAGLVRDSAAAFTEAQQTRSHRFEVEAPETSIVRADRETLQCVMWNLFENAVKYSPATDTVWVNLSRKGDRVEIAVRDHGVGIPKEEQSKVFDKFIRGTAAQASNIRGTGIGLAMAREIVHRHGGDITLESECGKGSTFRVLLPSA